MKRALITAGVIAAAMVTASSLYLAGLGQRSETVNAPRLLSAAKAYAEGLKAHGLAVPQSVTVQDLIVQGLLSEKEVKGFAGMDVSINLKPEEDQPNAVLVRARMKDGHEIVVLTDGSVQQVSNPPAAKP